MKNTVFNVSFVTLWEEGSVSTSAKLDIKTGRVFDIDSSNDGANYQHLRGEVIEVLSGMADVDSRQFDVELLGDDDYYIVDASDLALLRMALRDSLDDTSDVTLNTFDDEGNVVDTTSVNISKSAISDIIDHAAQLILVARAGGDVNAVMAELEEALTSRDVITEGDVVPSKVGGPGVAKKLAKAIQGLGYTKDGVNMPHGHALEAVSKVAGLPNWDTLSAMLVRADKSVQDVSRDAGAVQESAEDVIVRHYREHGGCNCPYCGSTEIEGNSSDFDGGTVTQEVGCNTCNASWFDVYKLAGPDLDDGTPCDHVMVIHVVSGGDERTIECGNPVERIEELKDLMSQVSKDTAKTSYAFLLLDEGGAVVEGTEQIVASWSGKKWEADVYGLSK